MPDALLTGVYGFARVSFREVSHIFRRRKTTVRSISSLAAITAATLLLAACESSPVAPVEASPASPSYAVLVNERAKDVEFPILLPSLPSCSTTGTVEGTGNVRILVRATQDGADGVHLGLKLQVNNLKAVNTVTGDRYVGGANAMVQLNLNSSDAANLTAKLDYKLIGRGRTPDLKLRLMLHLTVNANGDLTAEVLNGSLPDCGTGA